MKLIIDADACPKMVLACSLRLANQSGIAVITVANFNHVLESPQHIIVGDNPQEADLAIANLTCAGDVVITQDWGLAALVLAKAARCIHPSGWEYHQQSMDFMLEERELKAKFRRGGNRLKGPKKRSVREDEAFCALLRQLLLPDRPEA